MLQAIDAERQLCALDPDGSELADRSDYALRSVVYPTPPLHFAVHDFQVDVEGIASPVITEGEIRARQPVLPRPAILLKEPRGRPDPPPFAPRVVSTITRRVQVLQHIG